jgi:hypothetical protein
MGICKFNHHTITAMMAPLLQIIRYTQKKKVMNYPFLQMVSERDRMLYRHMVSDPLLPE